MVPEYVQTLYRTILKHHTVQKFFYHLTVLSNHTRQSFNQVCISPPKMCSHDSTGKSLFKIVKTFKTFWNWSHQFELILWNFGFLSCATYNLRKEPANFSQKGQIVNILGFAGHLWSLSRVLVCFSFTRIKNHPTSQAIQNPALGRMWPAGCRL